MKKSLSLIIFLVLCAATLFAQAPEKFSYQAVVRNASNALVTNAPVGVRVSILQGSASGNAVYVETHTASTNVNGLLTVEIGGGTVQQGSFAGIDWADGPFFLKTETDPAGGTNYTVTSVQQLMSVPYALYAKEAANSFSGDYNDLTNKPTIPQNVGDLINDAGYVTMDAIPAQVNADWNATEGVAEILNKPVNANFGHGIVFTKVNNAVGATDLTVGFTNYTLMTGGVVSLSFTNDVPAGATLNINNQGAKPIHYRGPALTAGVIKANDRCLFMYNATAGRYYLIANDRWGVDLDALATVAHTGSYNDLTDKPTIPEVPTNISAFVNDMGYITAIPDSFGGISLESDPIFTAWNKDYNDLTNRPDLAPVATSGDYNDLTNKPDLAPVATSGDYNDLTNKPTIPEVPTNISAFVNDMGYITAIPDSFGGISLESDPVFSAWNKDYNDLINKPVNADFGHGIVRTNVNNASGATDINVTFTGYQAVNGGVVSLAFTRNVPAGATLNINNQGAKAIRWKGTALTDGIIKAGDRCLFMYNSGNNSYYLLANDRWGVDIDALATVAHTGSYNDLTDKPELFSGDYNDLTNKPTIPTDVSAFINDAGYITQNQIPAQVPADWNATEGPAQILNKPTIPTVPTNISAFVNDMGYITAIPDSLGGISLESDPIFTAWNKDYNDLTNRPELFSGDYNDLTNKPVNADFGHGLVRTNVNNAAGATDINVTFTGYQAVNGGVVSLGFTRNVPAGATLNINGQGVKAIRWKGVALTDGIIKAGDRCLFMYNSGNNSYYLLANDRWGSDIDALATVAFTGNYNDLTNTPELFSGDYNDLTNTPELFSGNYNDLTDKPTIPTIPENVSAFNNDAGYITEYTETDPLFTAWNKDYNDLTNKPVNADFGQGLVRTNVNNAAGATDIAVTFTGYQLMNGGVVSLAFTRNVPAGATLNINGQGAKAIRWKGVALTDDIIKAGDRCLFMYNSGNNSYYLLANDRWGVDIDALATVAHTGSYNDLTDKPELAPVATSGNYNDLTNTPTIPTVPANVSAFNNDMGYITSDDVPAQVNADWNATEGAAQILNKPDLAPVATSGNYNDLTDKPTIPTVPINVSAFVNDMGYLTSIPDSFGGISIESDPVFSNWDRDYNSLTNKPNLAPVATSGNYNDLTNKPNLATVATTGNYNDLTNKPTNADFGHGIVRTNVNNASGATDISTSFTGYQAVNGGIVSLVFTRNVPAGATLNINNQGAKAIRWKGVALTDGVIKAGDRCLFMYNSGNNSYYLLANDRWGDDLEALATVAHTGSYNDLVDKPTLATVATTGNYNDLVDKPDLFSGNYNDLTGKPDLFSGNYEDLENKPTNATFGQGIVRTKVSNAVGATDISVPFTGYVLENGGVVSLAFTNNVPAGATLNINNKGAKPIYYKDAALAAGVIKAGDRCLFMYNSGAGRYYLLANDRWGADFDALATVAHTGNYNDLSNKPTLAAVATSGNYNDLTGTPEIPTVNNGKLTIKQNGSTLGTFTANQSTNKTVDITAPSLADVQALINSSLAPLQNQVDQLQNQNAALQSSLDNMNFICGTSTVRDYDGNEYNTVKIGEQCWLKENLRSTHYADGTEIPDGGSTESNTTGYRYDYTSSSIPLEQRGYLYNWPAVMHGAASSNAIPSGVQGICPTGWHVPSDAEWTQLTGYVSGQSQYWCGGNSANIAKALAAATTWGYATYVCSPSEDPASNDATGFSIVAAGYYSYPNFEGTVSSANITTSTADGTSMSWYYNLNYMTGEVYRQSYYRSTGLSVRCLRDATSTMGEQLNDLQEENAAMQQELDNMNFVCGVSKVTDYDGNEYNTVRIGNQCWTKENMRAEHYSDGTAIPDGGTNSSATTGYRYDYPSSTIPFEQRGYLYNWPAVMHGAASSNSVPSGVQGICPVGWHVPSDAEWTQLTDYVGSQSAYTCGGNSSYIAKALASTTYWNSGTATCEVGNTQSNNNATGFSALPAGYRTGSSFNYSGNLALFWSSTEASGGDAWYRCLDYDDATVYRNSYNENYGFSVRCLRDNLSMTEQLNSANEQIVTQQEQLDNMNFVCGVSTVKDYDGNEYNTVKIGNQCWTKENLRSEHYSNGVEIPAGTTTSTTTGYRYNYTSSSIPFEQRGYLYNWAAVMNGASSSDAIPSGVQGICPVGWHVPSDAEWSQLTDYVSSQSQYLCDASDNTSIAKALAASAWWNSSSTDCAVGKNPGNNNATDFAALPVGIYYTSSSEYIGSGNYVDFWSSTETSSSNAWYRYLNFNYDYVVRNNNHSKSSGFSVRCLRDVADGALGDLVRDLQEQNDNLSRAYECEHNSVVDYDGNVYSAVMIGNQCWMKENLRTMHYSDGVEIPAGSTTSTTTGYVYYNAASTIPVQQRGYLYNWKAVMRNASSSNANPSGVQGICPTGWHVPSDAEWTQLTDYVKSRSEYWCDENSNNIALALCSPSYWNTVNDSYMYPCYPGSNQGLHNNATGFGAVPAGCYSSIEGYRGSGGEAFFWSTTAWNSETALIRGIRYSDTTFYRSSFSSGGVSVRCLRDN